MSLKNFSDQTEREVLAMDSPFHKAIARIVVGGAIMLVVDVRIGGA